MKIKLPSWISQKKIKSSTNDIENLNKTGDFTQALSGKPLDPKTKVKITTKPKKSLSPKAKKILIGVGSFLLLLLTILVVLGFHSYSKVMAIKGIADQAQQTGGEAYLAFKDQNLPVVSEKLQVLDGQLVQIEEQYAGLNFWKFVPIASTYYNDGQNGLKAARSGMEAAKLSINSITPYADVLGFAGEGTFTGGTAENRLKLIIETLTKVMPEFDAITTHVDELDKSLSLIDAGRYPESIRGQEVRKYVTMSQDMSKGAKSALTEFRPVLEQLPSLMGSGGERRKYLILLQNDNEIRATGGFLTAYATVFVEDGVVTPEKSDDIYELDKKFYPKPPIPEELGRYLTSETKWNLRDMNISPDFQASMDLFLENYKKVRGEPQDIDGIIAIDTEFVTNLMDVLGPLDVPGYGTFTSENDPRCDCPQIIYILSEIITRPTPYLREDRKGIIGPLMRSLLTKAYSAPKTVWPELFSTGFEQMAHRHVQLYFLDEEDQQAAIALGGSGIMRPEEQGDFLAIIDSNLGGAKSNLFINYEVTNTCLTPENGKLVKSVEITYKNPRKADNCNLEAGKLCLNSTLNDWNRIYVPKGATLIKAQGYSEEPNTYEENGFTVFDGFFNLEPLGTAKLKLEYEIPYDAQDYQLKVWKQGGVTSFDMLVDVNGGQEKLTVIKDTSFTAPF